MATESGLIQVEVCYAEPDRQWLLRLTVPEGCTLAEAIERSGIRDQVPHLVVDPARLGVFGKLRAPDDVLQAGDRVEIYRPLQVDPKLQRRRRANAASG